MSEAYAEMPRPKFTLKERVQLDYSGFPPTAMVVAGLYQLAGVPGELELKLIEEWHLTSDDHGAFREIREFPVSATDGASAIIACDDADCEQTQLDDATILRRAAGVAFTIVPQPSILTGAVYLQGRTGYRDTLATMHMQQPCEVWEPVADDLTDDQAYFKFHPPEGRYALTAWYPGYLPAVLPKVVVVAGQSAMVPSVTLLGGDVTGDFEINLFDLVRVGNSYGQLRPADEGADINGDGAVNLFDLVLVGINYRASGWTTIGNRQSSPPEGAADLYATAKDLSRKYDPVRVTVQSPGYVMAGGRYRVSVRLLGAGGLQGADVTLALEADRITPGRCGHRQAWHSGLWRCGAWPGLRGHQRPGGRPIRPLPVRCHPDGTR